MMAYCSPSISTSVVPIGFDFWSPAMMSITAIRLNGKNDSPWVEAIGT